MSTEQNIASVTGIVEGKLAQDIRDGVATYLGFQPRSIEVHPDPRVRRVYAMRVTTPLGQLYDFLLNLDEVSKTQPRAEGIANALEEIEFTAWPPVSRD